jgi:hypothetical protein
LLLDSFINYNPGPDESPVEIKIRESNKKDTGKVAKENNLKEITERVKKPTGKVLGIPSLPKEVIQTEKKERKFRWDSIPYTAEMARSFNTVFEVLRINHKSEEFKYLPVAQSNFSYLKSGRKNGKPFNTSTDSINKMVSFLVPVINKKFSGLSGEEQKTLKQSFEIYSGKDFPEIKPDTGLDQPVKARGRKKAAPPEPAIESLPVTSSNQSEFHPDDLEFINQHREFLKQKSEVDRKLYEVLKSREKERQKRDREQKIKDALEDVPILSTLAISEGQEFFGKIYELDHFVLAEPDFEVTEGYERVKFLPHDNSFAGKYLYVTTEEIQASRSLSWRIPRPYHKNIELNFKFYENKRLFLVFRYTNYDLISGKNPLT